jgi:hypothetical protein
MQNWKKVLLLLLVLCPSFFFLSRAFSGNRAELGPAKLELSGPGGFEVAIADIDSLALIDSLPETTGTGGFALGWIKKGDFIRKSDNRKIRLVKNQEQDFIYLRARGYEIYFNLEEPSATQNLYQDLEQKLRSL